MKNSVVRKLSVAILVIVMFAACLSIFTACNFDDIEVTFKDMKGREFSVTPNEVNKIVCVGAGALRLYSYVGDMSKLCAVEEIEGSRDGFVSVRPYQIAYEDQFKALIAEGKTAGAGGPQAQKLQTEILAQLEPDLIFSCLSLDISELEAGEKAIGCPIVTLAYGQDKAFSSEVKQSLAIIGMVCATEAKATEVVVMMAAMEKELEDQAAGKTSPTFYLGCNSNWGKKGFLSTSKNYPLFKATYIKNVMDEEGKIVGQDGYTTWENILTADIDKIFLDAGGLAIFKGEYTAQGSAYPGNLAQMSAWTNDQIYLLMPNNAYDANVEMYYINAYFAASIAYGVNIDIEKRANEIFNIFFDDGKVTYNDVKMYGGYQQLSNDPTTWPNA